MSFSKEENLLTFQSPKKYYYDWEVAIPTSKSLTNRAVHLASLARGSTVLLNPLHSIDTETMVKAWVSLGAKIFVKESSLEIWGTGGPREKKLNFPRSLFVSNAGTVARFLTAALSLSDFSLEILGDAYMDKRPLGGLIESLEKIGVSFSFEKKHQCTPFLIQGLSRLPQEKLSLEVQGGVSSQYLSALMMVAPFFPAGLDLHYEKDMVSLPYVKMTADLMKDFGATFIHEKERRLFSFSPGFYERKTPYEVEVDYSSASYFLVLAAIHGASIKIPYAKEKSLQGDQRILDYLEKMGCQLSWQAGGVLLRGPQSLLGLEADLKHETDLVPALAVAALFAKTPSCFQNVSHMKFKECDRLAVLSEELSKLGARVFERDGNLHVVPGTKSLRAATLNTRDDHRMAMCFAVAGSRIPGLRLTNPDCVAKTFPSFFGELGRCL